MKLEQALQYFKSQAEIAEILDLTDSAVSVWKKRDKGIIPMKHILKLKYLSNGELDLNLDDYR